MTHRSSIRILLAVGLAAVAAWSLACRCGSSTPGVVGKAVTALDSIPGDVNAVVYIDAAGLQQGSLGRFIYEPLVVRQLEVWGGAPCAALARSARSAAFGIRLAKGGKQVQEVFSAAEGPSIADVRACVDENARRKGLSSAFEDIAGVRGLTDNRGLHVLASGERVVALSFPFNDRAVLEQVARVASGKDPALSGNAAFRALLERLAGDVTVALWETGDLFLTYSRDLENALAKSIPADLCATPTEVALALTMARAQGLGELAGIERFVKGRLAGREKACLGDLVAEATRTLGSIRAVGVTLSGRADIELGLMLEFTAAATAEDIRGVLADLVYILQILPARLDMLERDWPTAHGWLQKQIDIPRLRSALRNPIFKHISVGGEGTTVDLRIRVEEADVQATIESTMQTLTRLVAKD